MTRRALAAAVAVLTLASGVVASGFARGEASRVTTLRGSVGPGFTIELTKAGKTVTRLAPGTYRIVVNDRSRKHNFVLEKSQGAFERTITSLRFTGTKAATVRLTAGEWEIYCRPHKRTMQAEFAVGAAAKVEDAGDDHGSDG